MSERKIKRALISVYDKTGIVEFARALVDEFGVEIISTGGTANHLKENGIPVTLVEEITGFPEMLDGRVKTLHPKIHAAVLADRDNPEHMRQLKEQGIEPIDMVVVNLYPFEKTVADPNCTFEQAIEMIDIGGPCLLRAAAKNHKHVVPITRSEGLSFVLEEMRETQALSNTGRAVLASVVYEVTSAYDNKVDSFLTHHWTVLRCGPSDIAKDSVGGKTMPESLDLCLKNDTLCQYGENPHQVAALYAQYNGRTVFSRQNDSPTVISFNNYVDGSAAYQLCHELARAIPAGKACVLVKHTNPCGIGIGRSSIEAYHLSYLGDPNAAMGGILACSFDVDAEFASAVMDTYSRWGKKAEAGGFFLEVWVAPAFSENSRSVIQTTKPWGKRVRLLAVGDMAQPPDPKELEYKSITGGMLAQTRDLIGLNEDQWKVVTRREPGETEIADLRLAWLVAKHTKSNAISICKDGMLIGNGAGQMSRVMSCRIATWLAKENRHDDKLKGSVGASDAFFPFPDGPNILMDAGVTAIIQPGGSKNDDKVIAACDSRDVAMIFTGTRHFKH